MGFAGTAARRPRQAAVIGLIASVNLTDETLDAMLMLSGMQTVGTGIRPTLSIALKGPIAAPKRTLDASALASWLALRAVEQQSKRLDAME